MLTRAVAVGLMLAVILDTAGQLLWKFSVTSLPVTTQFQPLLHAVAHQPWFLAVGAIFICQLFNWLMVLKHADLSYAQPITSLSYVTVCTMSVWFFGDHISAFKILGIVCVLFGVWLLGKTASKTTAPV